MLGTMPIVNVYRIDYTKPDNKGEKIREKEGV